MIAHYLSALFPQMELTERAVFRVTRDADFEVSDEADDLLEAVELELRRRRFGDVVRLEVSSQMSSAMVDRLKLGLDVDDSHVYQVGGLLDLSELAQLLRVERPDLRDDRPGSEPHRPASRPGSQTTTCSPRSAAATSSSITPTSRSRRRSRRSSARPRRTRT